MRVIRRLSEATLAELPSNVERPRYDRRAVRSGVVHLGIGAFHRAHQGMLFDRVLANGDHRWGVIGASLRSADARDRLAPQDWLYTVVERDGAGERARVVGALRGVLVGPEAPTALIKALAAPETHLVTLTITEKGYLTGAPDAAENGSGPRTAAEFLAAALALRRTRGGTPFTALSCDNLPGNGAKLREAVLAAARAHDGALGDWIARHGAFPGTMVDRIVPATDDADIARLAGQTGVEDLAMVATEPFFQWVIEDRFAGPRPDFEGAGATLTDAVAPWEEVKLRLLNGAHSGIAYIGGLAGIAFVHDFVTRDDGRGFVEALWDESAATLASPPGLDLVAYRAALLRRFANPALAHRTRQIAIDGSQKLPQRLLAPIAARLADDLPIDALALAVAAWMRWQTGIDDRGQRFAIEDPLAAAIAGQLAAAGDGEQVDRLLAMRAIFPPALANPRARDRIAHWYGILERHGALAALSRLADRDGAGRA